LKDTRRLRPGRSEVERLVSDSTKARLTLGREPKCSLEDGLMRTIDWMRAHSDEYRPDVYAL
jgi:nucleoside-diphosphate-sugar epimerase